ncbi:programmed cell death protein 6 [Sarcoptes scabiei]|nr:programmed cell death protein 6 [Sarcoptes scabiei]
MIASRIAPILSQWNLFWLRWNSLMALFGMQFKNRFKFENSNQINQLELNKIVIPCCLINLEIYESNSSNSKVRVEIRKKFSILPRQTIGTIRQNYLGTKFKGKNPMSTFTPSFDTELQSLAKRFDPSDESERIRKILIDLGIDDAIPSIDRNDGDDDGDLEKKQIITINWNDHHHSIIRLNDRKENLINKLSMIDFNRFRDGYEAIQQLRNRFKAIDLIVASEDGVLIPIHSDFLAKKTPKFWSRIHQYLDDEGRRKELIENVRLRNNEGMTIEVPKLTVPNLDGRMLSIIFESMFHCADQQSNRIKPIDLRLTMKLLRIGEELGLDFLLETCLNNLCDPGKIKLYNSVLLFQIGLHFDHRLANISYQFILDNLSKIFNLHQQTLMTLSYDQLKTIIIDDHLNVPDEYLIWILINNWILFDRSNRLQYFWPLFLSIRFVFVEKFWIENDLAKRFAHLNAINDNFLLQSFKTIDKQKTIKINFEHFNPRIPNRFLLLYGGYEEGYPSNTFKSYDVRSKQWFQFRFDSKYPRIYHKIIVSYSTFRTVFVWHYSWPCWKTSSNLLPKHLSASSAVIVLNLPNAIDYTYYGQFLSTKSNHRCFNRKRLRSIEKIRRKNFGSGKRLLRYLFVQSKTYLKEYRKSFQKC